MSTYTQTNRHLEVVTPLGPNALLLTMFSGREGISHLFNFKLTMMAENDKVIPFERLLGQPATVNMSLSSTKKRPFNGIINSFSQAQRDNTFTYYHAEMVPHAWLLTQRTQSRIFQQMSVPDILKKVLDGVDIALELYGTFEPRDYCVQYRETDFDFASRLMEEEGIYYFFKHSPDGHKMVLANSPASHPDLPEQSKIVFEGRAGATRSRCRVTEWEKVQVLRPSKVTLWDHTFELPHRHLESTRAAMDSVAVGTVTHKLKLGPTEPLERYEHPGLYAQRFDGVDPGGSPRPADIQKIFQDNSRTAEIRIQEETTPAVEIRGSGYCRQFCTGFKFSLHRHFNADGAYVLTTIEHEATSLGDYRSNSGKDANVVYTNHFTCIPAGVPFRPARVTKRPTVEGSQTAVVVGPPGEEIFTDKYGRVKVQFHWDRQGKGDVNSSCWIRVASMWAGKRWGATFLPRVGQEVIVDFLEGDPDNPIIVGSVYNADQMPAYLGQGPDPKHPHDPKISGIKSNSTPGGKGYNELRFDDTAGKEQLFIHAQKDQDVRIEHDLKEFVGNDAHLIVQHDQFAEVTGDAHRKVHGDQSTETTGTESLTVGSDLQIKVGKFYAVDSTAEVHLKSGLNMVLEANALLTLKVGASSITLTPAAIIFSSPPVIMPPGLPMTGTGASPEKPKKPSPADEALSGTKAVLDLASKLPLPGPLAKIVSKADSVVTAVQDVEKVSQAAKALKDAAKNGTPLCEICTKAAAAAAVVDAVKGLVNGFKKK